VSSPRRLTLVISALEAGGAERVLATVANHWRSRAAAVTILTFAPPGSESFFDLDPGIKVRHLGLRADSPDPIRALTRNARRIQTLRREILRSRPDIVVSFMDTTNMLVLLATTGTGIPVVISERSDPTAQVARQPWRLLRPLLYRRAAAVVLLTQTAVGYFPPAVRLKSHVIPNPIVVEPHLPPRTDAAAEPIIVAMGRLDHAKGFDLLLRAFATVAPDFPDWRIEIWGAGPLLAELERLRDGLALADRVTFPGLTRDPIAVMRRGRVFVLSSRYESFGNVLVEAMASGLAVVAFDCPSGPREIVRSNIDGLLVPCGDVPGLSAAIRGLLSDPAERERLGTAAQEVLARFDLESVMAKWEVVLASVLTIGG
jgi:glycosyltransferase involved in cell wall biosynthesis